MKKKSIGVNAVLNIIKQCCAILFPLITFPYASRVLQVENYGKVSFGLSIITYFSLFAALGINNYTIREGARIRHDKEKLERFVSEVFTINLITMLLAYAGLAILIVSWDKLHSYTTLLIVQSLVILFTTIGTDWINAIYEDYLYITLRYIACQIFSIILLFCLVKKPDDYIVYSGITVIASAGANISNFFYIRRTTKVRLTLHPRVKKHILPMLILFCNALSVQIYVNSDITILGVLSGDRAVGVYSAASKIYNIVKQLLNALIVVMIPRVSALLGRNKKEEYNNLLAQSFYAILTFLMPMVTGIFMLSEEIIGIIGGETYADGYWALRILCFALAGAVFGNYYNNVILVPNKQEKYFLRATLTAALINIGLNFILIPIMFYHGAAITTVLAESIVMLYGIHYSKEYRSFSIDKKTVLSCVVGCAYIVLAVLFVKRMFVSTIWVMAISVIVSAIGYFAILYLGGNVFIRQCVAIAGKN